MYKQPQMRQYQQQAIMTSTPNQLVAKLYDLAIGACHREDRVKLRAVLAELMGSLRTDEGGELASRLFSLYEFCVYESVEGDLGAICDILSGLREAWHEGVIARPAAA